MTNPPEHSTFILRNTMPRTACVVALFCLLTTVAMPAAEAQTFQVLHTFSAGADGADPIAGLTIDGSGNLYGTAESGGIGCTDFGCGTVYKVVRRGATWLTTPIYSFAGAPDGANPVGWEVGSSCSKIAGGLGDAERVGGFDDTRETDLGIPRL